MRFLMSFFALFSFLLPPLALGEGPPEHAILKSCSPQSAPSLGAHEIYEWSEVDSEGNLLLFYQYGGLLSPIRMIVDGQEHRSPNPEKWRKGAVDLTYRVRHTEGGYEIAAEGLLAPEMVLWKSLTQVVTENRWGTEIRHDIIQTGFIPGTEGNPPGAIDISNTGMLPQGVEISEMVSFCHIVEG